MSEASDWEPLPDASRWSHPGELGAMPERSAATAPSAPPAAALPAPAAEPSPPDPAAEAALRQLQQRLAASKPATSLIAAVQQRELRQQRRRAAAQAPFAADAKVLQSTVRGPEDVPAAAAVAPPVERDPREDEPWFRKLPPSQQERLKAHWWHERHRHERGGGRLQRRLGRAVGYGALLYFVLSLLLVGLLGGFALVPKLTAGGALASGTAELCGGGRYIYSLAGAAVFVLVLGSMVVTQPLLMIALLLSTYTMGCLGMDGEMRRSGGFDPAG